MRAVTIDSDLATLFTFTPRKPPITPMQGVQVRLFGEKGRRGRGDAADYVFSACVSAFQMTHRRHFRCTKKKTSSSHPNGCHQQQQHA